MKRLKRCLLVLATLLLTGAGAAMPWAAARFQDLYGIAAQESLPLDAVNLTLRQESEIGAVLRLMGQPDDASEWTDETRLTRDEASAAALDALAELDRYGLLESEAYGYTDLEMLEHLKAFGGSNSSPLLLTGADEASAVIWVCHWKDNALPEYELCIDDATGLVLSGFLPRAYAEDPEAPYLQMDRWQKFFQDYYGIEILVITDESYAAGSRFFFYFDPDDGLGPWAMLVSIYSDYMAFGPCSPPAFMALLETPPAAAVGPAES